MFHYSSLVPSVLILFLYKPLKKKYTRTIYILLIISSFILLKFNIATILLSHAFGKYSDYVNVLQSTSLLKISVLNFYMIGLIYIKNFFIKSSRDSFLFNALFLGVLFVNIFADFTPVTRLSYYFLITQIILVPKLIYSFKNINLKVLMLIAFVSYYILMFSNALYYDYLQDGYPKMTPYQNYLFKDSEKGDWTDP